MQESIYIFILHCRILTSPGAKRGAEAFENGFSWIPGQWSCRHTHTQSYLHCLKSICFFIDPRVYLSNLNHCVVHMEDIDWFQHQLHTVSVNDCYCFNWFDILDAKCLFGGRCTSFPFDTQPATLFPCLESDVLIRVQCQGTGVLGGRTRLGCFEELLGGRTRWGCFASKDISQTLMMSTVLHGSCLVNFWPFSQGTCPATILSWKNHFSGSNILIFSYQRGRMDQSKALCPVDDHPLTCFGAWLQAEHFVDTIWVSSHV